MAVRLSPASRRARASRCWRGVSLWGRPMRTPLARARPALARPCADQLALELGQPGEHREHEPAMGRGGVGPGVQQRAKRGPLSDKAASTLRRSRVLRASRSRRVTSTTSPGPTSRSSRASCARSRLGPRGGFAKHPGRPGRTQLIEWRRQRLPVRAHPRVAQHAALRGGLKGGPQGRAHRAAAHAQLSHLTYAQANPLKSLGLGRCAELTNGAPKGPSWLQRGHGRGHACPVPVLPPTTARRYRLP